MEIEQMNKDREILIKEVQDHEQKRIAHKNMAEKEQTQSIAKQGIIEYLTNKINMPKVKKEIPEVKKDEPKATNNK